MTARAKNIFQTVPPVSRNNYEVPASLKNCAIALSVPDCIRF